MSVYRFSIKNNTIEQGPTIDLIITGGVHTVGEIKGEIADRFKYNRSSFDLERPGGQIMDDKEYIHQLFPHANSSASIFINLKRKPEFEDSDFDDMFETSVRRITINMSSGSSTYASSYRSNNQIDPSIVPASSMGGLSRLLNSSYFSQGGSSQTKSNTGYTGLANQGATCYMNSLIQSLYMTPEFRSAVYNWSFMEKIQHKIEKLKREKDGTQTDKDTTQDKKKEPEQPVDLSWLEAADELMELWRNMEREEAEKKKEQENSNNGNNKNNSNAEDSKTSDQQSSSEPQKEGEVVESKFLQAAKSISNYLYEHAQKFEEWKHSVEANSIPFQLRLLFSKLQLSKERSVATKGLTKSFGWTGMDAFTQHDVQELLRVLQDALEKAFSGTPQNSLINDLYQGTSQNAVTCLHCGYKSTTPDTYLDLQLSVKPFGESVAIKSVEEALDKYVQTETLDNENQYFCSKCNTKRDATRGVEFTSIPYLLTLQLKRFDYDWETSRRIKLCDRVSFPLVLNMNRFLPSTKPTVVDTTLLNEELTQFYKSNVPPVKLSSIPDGIVIRHSKSTDLKAIIGLLNDSFVDVKSPYSEEAVIVEKVLKTLSPRLYISLVAVDTTKISKNSKSQTDEPTIVGYVLFSPVALVNTTNTQFNSFEYIGVGPLAVSPRYQKKHIGTALMTHGIALCALKQAKIITVLGNMKYYEKFGFIKASDALVPLQYSPLHESSSNDNNIKYSDHFGVIILEESCFSKLFSKNQVEAKRPVNVQYYFETVPNLANSIVLDVGTKKSSQDEKDSIKEDLNLALSDGPSVYELFAILIHRGSAQGGHYYAYIKEFGSNNWFEFNDSIVSHISKSDIVKSFGEDSYYSSSETAYMLIYRQFEPSRNMDYPTSSMMPPEILEAMEMENKRQEAKEALKRIEAQKIAMNIKFRGMTKPIRLMPELTVLDAVKAAAKLYGINFPIEDLRLHPTRSFIVSGETADLFNMDTQLKEFSRDQLADVVLQARLPGKEFKPYNPRSTLVVVQYYSNASWALEPIEIFLPLSATLKDLRSALEEEFGIPAANQIITVAKPHKPVPVTLISGSNEDLFGRIIGPYDKPEIFLEPFSDDIVDHSYVPQKRRKLVTSSYKSSPQRTEKPSLNTLEGLYGEEMKKLDSQNSILTSSSDVEINIVPIGEESSGGDSTEDSQTHTKPIEVSSSDTPKEVDSEYEIFHDTLRHIIYKDQKINPRSIELVKDIQNRLVVKFGPVGTGSDSIVIMMSKKNTVGELRARIATHLNIDPNTFIMAKAGTYYSYFELNDAKVILDKVVFNSTLHVSLKAGTPTQNGEVEVKFYPYLLPTQTYNSWAHSTTSEKSGEVEGNSSNELEKKTEKPEVTSSTKLSRVSFSSFTLKLNPDNISVGEAKKMIQSQLAKSFADKGLVLEVSHIRLRKIFSNVPERIGLDDNTLDSLGNKIMVQILDHPEPKTERIQNVIVLQQFFPSTWELGDAVEMLIDYDTTHESLMQQCLKIMKKYNPPIEGMEVASDQEDNVISESNMRNSNIPLTSIQTPSANNYFSTGSTATSTSYTFMANNNFAATPVDCSIRASYNLPNISDMNILDWITFKTRLSKMVVVSDGAFVYFKDPSEPFRILTPAEKRLVSKSVSSVQSYSSSSSYYSRESALKIHVDD